MEMQEVATEEERKQEDKGASEPKLEAKTAEEAEPVHYSELQSPPEDIYSEAYYGCSSLKTEPSKQTAGNTRLHSAVCVFLTIICLVLLLVVIILCVKLQTGSNVCPETGSTVCLETEPIVCPEKEETATTNKQRPSSTCSYEQCQTLFPKIQHLGCQQCGGGWLTFGRSCFYLSTTRLTWDESQSNCSASGGSLAVITSQKVQNFLTKKGNLMYWMGLRKKGATWTWVNNTVLQESYWRDVTSEGDCGILSSEDPPEKNWIKASCQASTYFICQLTL